MNFPVTSDGIRPLMLACSFGNKIIMQVIMKNKLTDKEIKDQQGFNALYYATFYGHRHILEELGRREVPYEVSQEGTSCLHVACKKGFSEIVHLFLNYKEICTQWKPNHPWDGKIDVNARKKHNKNLGVTPAFLAAKNGNVEIFKELHKNGALIEDI